MAEPRTTALRLCGLRCLRNRERRAKASSFRTIFVRLLAFKPVGYFNFAAAVASHPGRCRKYCKGLNELKLGSAKNGKGSTVYGRIRNVRPTVESSKRSPGIEMRPIRQQEISERKTGHWGLWRLSERLALGRMNMVQCPRSNSGVLLCGRIRGSSTGQSSKMIESS